MKRRREGTVPSGDPGGKWSPFLAGEFGAPVVEAAGGRVRRADLRHGQRHAAVEGGDEQPPQRHGHGAAVAQAGVVGDGHAHEHGNDGERQGEVGKNAIIRIISNSAHVAEEKTELRTSIQFSSERIEGVQLASLLTRGLA